MFRKGRSCAVGASKRIKANSVSLSEDESRQYAIALMYYKLVIVWITEFPDAIGDRLYLEQDWPMFLVDAAEVGVGG